MIDWNDCTPLTRGEFDSFISAAVPFLQAMEMKNGWDFFVNDLGHVHFCQDLMCHAFSLNEYKDYQIHYPKVQDMIAIDRILRETDWTEEDSTLRKYKESEIWRLVLNRVNAVADAVL